MSEAKKISVENAEKFISMLEEAANLQEPFVNSIVPDEVSDDFLDKELKRDVIAEAEKQGNRYSNNGLGLLLDSMFQNAIKDKALKKRGDTVFSMNTKEYLDVVTDFGFEIIYEGGFVDKESSRKGRPEKHYILWEPKRSILLNFDTFDGQRNGGEFYYNICLNPNAQWVTSSGHTFTLGEAEANRPKYPGYEPNLTEQQYEERSQKHQKEMFDWKVKYQKDIIWVGYHDCREALKFNIKRLDENGEFVKKWVDNPSLHLINFGDHQNKEHKGTDAYKYMGELTQERIDKLPKYVQEAIACTKK